MPGKRKYQEESSDEEKKDPDFVLETKKERTEPCANRSSRPILHLMKIKCSPAKKATIISDASPVRFKSKGTETISPSKVTFSTPSKRAKTSSVSTPKGTKLYPASCLTGNGGAITIFLSEKDKADEKTLDITAIKSKNIQSSLPEASLSGFKDIEITAKMIKEAYLLNNKRTPNQNTLATIPAQQLAKEMGLDVTLQWLHFLSFAHLGNAAQILANLGAGTDVGNGLMELLNTEISHILLSPNGPKALYVSAEPTFVEDFKKIRLLQSITLTVKDHPGSAPDNRFIQKTFNTLRTSKICPTESDAFRAIMRKKFILPKENVPPSEENIPVQTSSLKL